MDIAIFEGSDLFLDLETKSYNEKRHRGEALFTAQDKNADEDYVSFLEDLHEYWEAKFVEDDDVDPTYMEFFGNLKEYKNAYMCDVSIENGVLSTIYYEVENESPNSMKRKTPQPRRGTGIHKKRNLDVDSDHISGPKYSGSGKKTSIVVDETYEKFLNSLHITKDSVFYENGDQERIFYESSDQQTMGVTIKKNTRPPSSTLRPSTPIPGPQTPPSRAKITSQKKPTPTDSLNILSTSNNTCKIGKKSRVSSSLYWKTELHDYLRQPYERKEFDELWEELSTRKPVLIYRDSRSGGSYRPGHMGKSLLELYPG